MEACHKPDQPLILFALADYELWQHLGMLPADVLSVGPHLELPAFRSSFPEKALQGNLDSRYLLGDRDIMLKAATDVLESMRDQPGYVFNLGHGITPKTPESNVAALVECVQSWS